MHNKFDRKFIRNTKKEMKLSTIFVNYFCTPYALVMKIASIAEQNGVLTVLFLFGTHSTKVCAFIHFDLTC